MSTETPSLDESIRVRGFTDDSFQGLTPAQAVEKMGLHDGVIRNLGDDHKARCARIKAELLERFFPGSAPATTNHPVDQAQSLTHTERSWLAMAIIEAGDWRRAGCPPLREPTNALARAILAAGAKARGEIEPDLPTNPTARAIVLAGRRRRGAID
jgi:hypothetical protein